METTMTMNDVLAAAIERIEETKNEMLIPTNAFVVTDTKRAVTIAVVDGKSKANDWLWENAQVFTKERATSIAEQMNRYHAGKYEYKIKRYWFYLQERLERLNSLKNGLEELINK